VKKIGHFRSIILFFFSLFSEKKREMAPVEFGDIGKASKDLLSKDFNFGKTKFEAKTISASGVEFTSNVERNNADGVLRGEVKTKVHHRDSGLTVTDSYSTTNDLSLKVEAAELAQGVKVDLETKFNLETKQSADLKLGFGFKNDWLNSSLSTNLFGKRKAKLDAVVKSGDYLLGTQASFDASTFRVSEINTAVGYSANDLSFSFHTTEVFTSYSAFVSHKVSTDVHVSTAVSYRQGDERSLVEFGSQFALDNDASLKLKFDSSGKVGLGYIHKVRPDLKASFGLLIDSHNLDQSGHKYGFGLTFEPKN